MCAAFLTIPASCSDIDFTTEGYRKAVLSGLEQIPEARQFDEIFGKENVDHFISYSGSLEVGSDWNSELFFGGRYILTMQIPVRMGRSFDEVLEALDSPKFYLREIDQIKPLEGGRFHAKSDGDDPDVPYPFDARLWEKVYRGGGDFSAAGIDLKKHEPVEHFDEYVAVTRRGRVQIAR